MICCLFLFVSAGIIFAQDEKPKTTLWHVEEYVIKPSKATEYESLMKDFAKHCANNEYEYNWSLWRDSNFHYYSFMKVKDNNEINLLDEKMGPIVQNWGKEKLEKW